MFLFKKPQPAKERLYYIEIDDEKIDQQITKLIVILQRKIFEFRKNLDETTMTIKEEILNEVYSLMIKVKNNIQMLAADVNRVMGLEFKSKDYFNVKDDTFLADKRKQLEKMYEAVNSFLQIAEQKPSAEALRTELIQQLVNELDDIDECTKKIIDDDRHLQQIYKQVMAI